MLKKFLKNQKGLTLVELLAVVVILGIVSSIAVVSIGNVIQNSREDAVRADAIQILNAAELYIAQGGEIGSTTETGVGSRELSDLLNREGSFENVANWTVTQDTDGTLRFTGTTTAGSVTMTFTNASVSDIDDARGETTIPVQSSNGENSGDED